MQLCEFLNCAAYLFTTDEDFQSISDLAGIQWNDLPDFDSVKTVRKYLAMRASMSHRAAVHELRDDIRFLDMTNPPLDKLGRDEDVIGHQLRTAFKDHQYQTLAKEMLAYPAKAESLFKQFDISSVKSIGVQKAADFVPDAFYRFSEKQREGTERVLLPGFKMISHMIGGFNPGRIVMLLGETGFGKTNFALNLLTRAATKYKCLYVNMEMPLEDITNRLAVLTTGKSFADLYAGNITLAEVESPLRHYGENLKFTEGYSMSIQSIEALIRREHETGLDFVVIDYDQKIEFPYSKSQPEWKQLQNGIQHIENISKELNFNVIMLAQVNREGTISASHRATYAAHTVLNFKSNDAGTIYDKQANAIVSAEKNRHGEKDAACLVSYNSKNLSIKEIQVIQYSKPGGKNGTKQIL